MAKGGLVHLLAAGVVPGLGLEPLHGAATGVPGSAARSAWPGGPCGGAAGEPAAAGQAAEDLCRVRAVPHAGWETAPWYCATTLVCNNPAMVAHGPPDIVSGGPGVRGRPVSTHTRSR